MARRPIRYEIPTCGIGDRDLAATIMLERDPDDELDHATDDNERGLKDTVRVNPNELVEIAVRFHGLARRTPVTPAALSDSTLRLDEATPAG